MTAIEFLESPTSTNPKSLQNLNSLHTKSNENINKFNKDKETFKIDNTILNITEYLVLLEENPVKNFEKAETISLGKFLKIDFYLKKKCLYCLS